MEAVHYNDIFASNAIDMIMVGDSKEFIADITKWAKVDEALANKQNYYKDASIFVTNLINKTKSDIVSQSNKMPDVQFYTSLVTTINDDGTTINGVFYPKRVVAAARDYFEMIKTHPAAEGMTSEHALGIIGNLLAESHFDGTILEGNGAKSWSFDKQIAPPKIALGVAQFTRSSGCVFLENTVLSYAKLNKIAQPNLKQLGSAIFNPVYQLDHLFRMMTGNNHVAHNWNDKFIANELKSGGFFNKNISSNQACSIFFNKYERPSDRSSNAILKRQAGMKALIKLM